MRDLLHRARSFQADLIEIRRDLHRHPELSFAEARTAATVARVLREVGLEPRTDVGGHGVIAEVGTGDGPIVALRADMDALPVTETNDVEYRSTRPGVMHACGHDAHTTMLLGAARVLVEEARAGRLPGGTVRLLFQPAEERSDERGVSGAAHMVAAGAMDGVAATFALHVGPHLPAGMIFSRPGPVMAGSDTFTAHVLGSSSHGARPDAGVDAVVLAAHVVLAAQNGVARRIGPLEAGVLTIGSVKGGTAENILADRVTLDGTIRYFEPEVRRRLWESLEQALAVADTLGGDHELDLREGYPPTINDPGMAELAMAAARDVLGADRVGEAEPMMAAEDFSLLLHQAPGAFMWLGAAPTDRPRELHRPDMNIDEAVLPVGAAVLAACAARALERR